MIVTLIIVFIVGALLKSISHPINSRGFVVDGAGFQTSDIIVLLVGLLNSYFVYRGYAWAQILLAIQYIIGGAFFVLAGFMGFGYNLFTISLYFGIGAMMVLSAILLTLSRKEVKAYNWYIKKKTEMAGKRAVEDLEKSQQ